VSVFNYDIITNFQAMVQHSTNFQTRKSNCLSKRDKSSAGRIDPRAVEICDAVNRRSEYYTTSSCAGRCFLYRGDGIKSWQRRPDDDDDVGTTSTVGNGQIRGGEGVADDGAAGVGSEHGGKFGFFERYRVNHDLIREPTRYFDLSTLVGGLDPTGGGDAIPCVGQFDHGNNAAFRTRLVGSSPSSSSVAPAAPVWLRYEPFILHVMCRSLGASSALMALARPAFKNVGLTSWHDGGGGDGDDKDRGMGGRNDRQSKAGRYLVAIWGDEGLDMPLSLPSTPERGVFYNPEDGESVKNAIWLAQLINERHARNWKKIERFVESMRSLDDDPVDLVDGDDLGGNRDVTDGVEWTMGDSNLGAGDIQSEGASLGLPRSYDGKRYRPSADNTFDCCPAKLLLRVSFLRLQVVGDVAILNSLPKGDVDAQRKVGESIMSRNKAIKVFSTMSSLSDVYYLFQCRGFKTFYELTISPAIFTTSICRFALLGRIHYQLPSARLASTVWYSWPARSAIQS
jgi:tRNA(Phe) wybutosine-synthesizing methylase Tyw3